MSEMRIWAEVLALLALSGWGATRGLAVLKPELTTKQRWEVVLWVVTAASFLHQAWEVGKR